MSKNKRDTIKKQNQQSIYQSYRTDVQYDKNQNNKRKFTGISHSLMINKNFLALKHTSKIVYFYMLDYANGNQTFTFPKRIYSNVVCNSTFDSAKKQLIEYGFIEEVANGKNTRTASIYKFSEKWHNFKVNNKKRQTHFSAKKDLIISP